MCTYHLYMSFLHCGAFLWVLTLNWSTNVSTSKTHRNAENACVNGTWQFGFNPWYTRELLVQAISITTGSVMHNHHVCKSAWSNEFQSWVGLTRVSSSVLKMNLEVRHSLDRIHFSRNVVFNVKLAKLSMKLCCTRSLCMRCSSSNADLKNQGYVHRL